MVKENGSMMKCVLVINEELSPGLAANTAAVLAVSIGHQIDGLVGEDVADCDHSVHRGITQIPLPLLKSNGEHLRELRSMLLDEENQELYFVDFCDVAQKSKNYQEYQKKMEGLPGQSLNYLGIALCGPRKLISQYTGSLPLL